MRVTCPLDSILAALPWIGDGIFTAIHRADSGEVISGFLRQLCFIDGSSSRLQ
jgi:hypothetical protein